MLRIQSEIVDGIEHLVKIQHAVNIFGSARLLETSPYYAQAETLGRATIHENQGRLSELFTL